MVTFAAVQTPSEARPILNKELARLAVFGILPDSGFKGGSLEVVGDGDSR